jgi:hypothetical protein
VSRVSLQRALSLAFVCFAAAASAGGTTYFIAPNGGDGDTGLTPAQAWKTFAFAIPKLNPGDTLVLEDGTYSLNVNGTLEVNCQAGAKNGTADAPILVRAANERKAWLRAESAWDSMRVRYCSFWEFRGLRVSGRDITTLTQVVHISDSSDLVLRGFLVHDANRYFNTKLINLIRVQRTLVEDTEFYDFHRAGLEAWLSNGNILRRAYFNSRGKTDLDGGFVTEDPTRGDSAVKFYEDGSDNLVENIVSEGQTYAVNLEARGAFDRNRVMGSIALGGDRGIYLFNRGLIDAEMAHDTLISDFVTIDTALDGVSFRSTKRTRCDNCTFIFRGSTSQTGLEARRSSEPGDGTASAYVDSSLAVATAGRTGFQMVSQVAFLVRGCNAWGFDAGFLPGDAGFQSNSTIDPGLGGCLAWLPDSSAMKGSAPDGGDIGANVLYRTEKGRPTGTPLWNPATGAFPCGATVAGFNDDPGNSCIGVHVRLESKTPACPFPAGYGLTDAGTLDGGTGGEVDGGSASVEPKTLRVGCGCDFASGGTGLFALLLVGLLRGLKPFRR